MTRYYIAGYRLHCIYQQQIVSLPFLGVQFILMYSHLTMALGFFPDAANISRDTGYQ